MIKLYSQPRIQEAEHGQMGLFQVVKNLHPYLAKEFTFVDDPTQADVIISHAGAYKLNPLPHQGFIAICHGLHPTGSLKMHGIHYEENAVVIRNLIIADKVVVPSKWVALALQRDILLDPLVCQWGINPAQWVGEHENKGYVLWNKNRADLVCNPEYMQAVAHLLPHRHFVSTFGNPTKNVEIIGTRGMKHLDMLPYVKHAGVYLATTKETGDIGSREALASGVPVVAFAQGAVLDFLQHGVNGYLAQVGDVQDLAKGIEYCFEHRDILSQNARTLAQSYTWDKAGYQIVELVKQVYADKHEPKPLVSVVIPCHNYSQYVGNAIASVVNQEGFDTCELLVVDDASTDDSLDKIREAFGARANCRLIAKPVNQGVAQARNTGILKARGKYILPLDADDMLNKDALKILSAHLENNPYLGVAFGRLAFMDGRLSDWLTLPFDYTKQVAGEFNQIPTCSMFRRKDALRVGLYRTYMQPAEDADLFTRIVTFTGKKAERVTDNVTFFYRMHEGSLSRIMRRDPYKERGLPFWGKQRPLAAPPIPPNASNPVLAYDKPLVQVKIVGNGDYGLTLDALYEQTYWNWTLEDNLAPLIVRVEAGKWLGKSWLQDLLSNATLEDKNDGVSLYKVQNMACCGKAVKQMTPSDGDLMLVRWTIETHNNPIPSWTGKVNAVGEPIRYRGNLGSELYVHKDDYEYALKGNKQCWEVVPQVQQLTVENVITPAPIPVLIPTMPATEDLPDKPTVVIPEFSTLQNDEPAPSSEKRKGRKPKTITP